MNFGIGMRGVPAGLPSPGEVWGTFAPDAPGWLPLADHGRDVAAMFAALCAIPQVLTRLQRAAGRPLGDVDVERLCAFAFLHDFGKCASGFQRRLAEPEQGIGHMRAAAALLLGDSLAGRLYDALGLPAMAAWGLEQTLLSLLLATLAHHGRPPDLRRIAGSPGEEKRIRAASSVMSIPAASPQRPQARTEPAHARTRESWLAA